MSPGLRNVLGPLSELAHNDSETDVSENNINKAGFHDPRFKST